MRVFFALLLPPEAAVKIESWRQLNWPLLAPLVPAANFHITLSFIGEIERPRLQELHALADRVAGRAFNSTFDQLGFWPGPGVFWLGCQSSVAGLEQLHKELQAGARQAGFAIKERDFEPHITLSRRPDALPAEPLVAPDFNLQFSEFHLLESVRAGRGIHYESLLRWKLDS